MASLYLPPLTLPLSSTRSKYEQFVTVTLKQTDEFMIVDYPITDVEREKYKAYRTYLRDYTLTENWLESNPLKLEEWK